MPNILDHVDLRVRNRSRATAFYDAFLALLGAVKNEGAEFTTWRIQPTGASAADNFGICEDSSHVPGAVRVAFAASSRAVVDAVAATLRQIGAGGIEMDDGDYGADFYAVFFEDPDGNKLEVCFNG